MSENANPLDEVTDKPQVSMRVDRTPLDKLTPPPTKVREIQPVVFFDRLPDDADEVVFDFRPLPVEEEDEVIVVPKDLYAQESVDYSDLIPELEQETTVPVVKDSGQLKESESSTPTS